MEMTSFQTLQPSRNLINEIVEALRAVKGFGSIEIYVQDNAVTQITVRNIKKITGNGSRPAKKNRKPVKSS